MATVPATRRAMTAPRRAPGPRAPEHAAPRPRLRVVDERAPRRFSATTLTAIGLGAVFVVLFGLVVFHTVLLQNQQRIDQLDAQVRDEQARYQQLRLQVAQLESPQRIIDVATQKLGLVPPATTTYLTPTGDDAAAARQAAAASQRDNSGTADPDTGPSGWPQVKPYLGAAP